MEQSAKSDLVFTAKDATDAKKEDKQEPLNLTTEGTENNGQLLASE